MKKLIFSVATLFLGIALLHAQETTAEKPLIPVVKLSDNVQVKLGGFVRAEYYYDNNRTEGGQDDLFSFFPKAESKATASSDDQNAISRSNISTQATRFNALFTGPDVLNAKSSAFFEFDFTGGLAPSSSNVSTVTNSYGVRARHAWAKLNWTKAEVLIGKTWNPLADLSETASPSVVGLNTGAPFRPFGRDDQLRIVWKPNSTINVLAAAVYQTEYKSYVYTDAIATLSSASATSNDIRANPIPDLHLQLHFKTPSVFAGIISEYKVIRPALQTSGTNTEGTTTNKIAYNATETVSSYALGAFLDYKKNKFNAKGSVLYGQNLGELLQQGGYAVKTYDATTGARTYTSSNALTYWANLTYGSKWVVGLFGGYEKNLGFNDNLYTTTGSNYYTLGRWLTIDHIYRVAPSLKYSIGRLVLSAEVEYNVAAYGTVDPLNKGKIKDAKEKSGVRGTFATTFLF